MAKVKPSSPSAPSSAPSAFRCSADDPFLHTLITCALGASPWLTVDTAVLRIQWRVFLDHLESLPSRPTCLPSSLRGKLLAHLEAMGETYGLSLFAPGQLASQIPIDSSDHLSGLVITQQRQDLASPYVPWLESYKDLAERLLYEWEEARQLGTPPSRSQHLHSRIVPRLRDDLLAATSTQSATLTRVLYPLAARLRLGSALPAEIEAVTRVTASLSGERGGFLPLLQGYAQGAEALHQAWRSVRATVNAPIGSNVTDASPPRTFSHPSWQTLGRQNKTFANLVYQRSLYGCDLAGTPKRAAGYARIDKTHSLLARDGQATKRLPALWPYPADRVMYQMCQSLRDFCTYFYAYAAAEGAHARKVLDQILCLEQTVPRVKPSSASGTKPTEDETIFLDPEFLPCLDQLIEHLLDHSPLLVILATGMLCTYAVPTTGGWGFALGPQVMATVLAGRGLGGALPFQYLRPPGPDPLQLARTASAAVSTEANETAAPD